MICDMDDAALRKLLFSARLQISEQQAVDVKLAMSNIVFWIASINEVNTMNVQAMYNTLEDVVPFFARQDLPQAQVDTSDIFACAPRNECGFFIAPEVLVV